MKTTKELVNAIINQLDCALTRALLTVLGLFAQAVLPTHRRARRWTARLVLVWFAGSILFATCGEGGMDVPVLSPYVRAIEGAWAWALPGPVFRSADEPLVSLEPLELILSLTPVPATPVPLNDPTQIISDDHPNRIDSDGYDNPDETEDEQEDYVSPLAHAEGYTDTDGDWVEASGSWDLDNEVTNTPTPAPDLPCEVFDCDYLETPTWGEVSAARAAGGEDYPAVFWATDTILRVKIGDKVYFYQAPEEALEEHGDNPDFVREFIFLMEASADDYAADNDGSSSSYEYYYEDEDGYWDAAPGTYTAPEDCEDDGSTADEEEQAIDDTEGYTYQPQTQSDITSPGGWHTHEDDAPSDGYFDYGF